MAHYFVKAPREDDVTITIKTWKENKFAVVEADVQPQYDIAVEIPEDLYNHFYMYDHPQGKRHRAVILRPDLVNMIGPDSTGRWKIAYTDDQLSIRAAMFRWVAVNAYIPDMERMGLASPERVTELQQQLESLNTDDEIKQFTVNNLYYDL